MPKSIADCFEEAATILEVQGWAQEEFTSYSGAHCLIGALYEACPDNFCHGNRSNPRYNLLNALGFKEAYNAFDWNDKEGRRASTVIRRLRTRAAKLRSAQGAQA